MFHQKAGICKGTFFFACMALEYNYNNGAFIASLLAEIFLLGVKKTALDLSIIEKQ